jgi:Leucine-rich repeat (LRR) protein
MSFKKAARNYGVSSSLCLLAFGSYENIYGRELLSQEFKEIQNLPSFRETSNFPLNDPPCLEVEKTFPHKKGLSHSSESLFSSRKKVKIRHRPGKSLHSPGNLSFESEEENLPPSPLKGGSIRSGTQEKTTFSSLFNQNSLPNYSFSQGTSCSLISESSSSSSSPSIEIQLIPPASPSAGIMEILPAEMLVMIFSQLKMEDLKSISQTCPYGYKLASMVRRESKDLKIDSKKFDSKYMREIMKAPLNKTFYRNIVKLEVGRISHISLKFLKDIPNLTSLNASNTALTPQQLGYIGNRTTLKRLNISKNKYLESFSPLTPLKSLKSLNISGCKVTDEKISSLPNLENLTHLNISWNDMEELTPLPLPQLKFLNISYNSIKEINPSSLPKSLTSLDLSRNFMSEASIKTLRKSFPLLKNILNKGA